MAFRDSVNTEFLNVDLDVASNDDLAALVEALEPAVHVLYCGKAKRGYFARMELARQPRTPDEAIRKLAAAVEGLRPPARRLWKRARTRHFNVGIQSGSVPLCSEFELLPPTLAAAVRLGVRVVFTVYGTGGADRGK